MRLSRATIGWYPRFSPPRSLPKAEPSIVTTNLPSFHPACHAADMAYGNAQLGGVVVRLPARQNASKRGLRCIAGIRSWENLFDVTNLPYQGAQRHLAEHAAKTPYPLILPPCLGMHGRLIACLLVGSLSGRCPSHQMSSRASVLFNRITKLLFVAPPSDRANPSYGGPVRARDPTPVAPRTADIANISCAQTRV